MKNPLLKPGSPIKSTISLLVVLLILVVAIIASDLYSKNKTSKQYTGTLITKFDTEEIQTMTFSQGEKTVTLQRADDTWQVLGEKDDTYPADADKLQSSLESFRDIRVKELISKNADNHGQLEVDTDAGLRIELKGKDDSVFADIYTGKSGPGFSGQYARRSDSAEVYLMRDSLRRFAVPDSTYWKDKTIFSFRADDALQLAIKTPEQKLVFAKTASGWEMNEPEALPVEKVKQEKMNQMVQALSALITNQFAEKATLEETELEAGKETLKIFIALDNGSNAVLYAGKLLEDENMYYVRKEGDDMIFKVMKASIDNLWVKMEDIERQK